MLVCVIVDGIESAWSSRRAVEAYGKDTGAQYARRLQNNSLGVCVALTLHEEARARGGFAHHRLGAKVYEGDYLSLFWWLCVFWTADCVWDIILFS